MFATSIPIFSASAILRFSEVQVLPRKSARINSPIRDSNRFRAALASRTLCARKSALMGRMWRRDLRGRPNAKARHGFLRAGQITCDIGNMHTSGRTVNLFVPCRNLSNAETFFPGPFLREAINPCQCVKVQVDAHAEELFPPFPAKPARRSNLPIALSVD